VPITWGTPVPASPPSPLRLVLVEDSDGYAALVERRLAEEPDPPALVRFSRLEEALRHLSYVHADCVLLDVGLPDAQDVEGVERILEVAPTVPLVVLTGSEDEALAVRLLRAGAQDHVVKGTETGATLLRAARHAIERRRRGDHEAARRTPDPARPLTPGPVAQLRDAGAGMAALLACVGVQLAFPSLGGVGVLMTLAVGWLAARAGLGAGLAGAAAASASLTARDVLLDLPAMDVWSVALRVGSLAVVAVVAWQATRRLRAGNELLHAMLGGTTDAIAISDPDGRHLLVNDPMLALIGREREDVIGRTDAELLPPDLAGPARARDESVLASGTAQRYWRTAAYAQGERTYSVVKLPYRDAEGRVHGVITMARDETPMREIEERASHFFAMAPDMLCTIDAEGRLERTNEAWTRQLGWTVDELRSRALVDFVHPEDRAMAARELDLLLGGLVEACSNRLATKTGGWRDIEWSARLDGGEQRLYAVARDVTDRNRLARRLADSEARYRAVVHNVPGLAVLTFDHDLRFTFAAGRALDSGATARRLIGRTLAEIVTDPGAWVPRARAALAGEAQSFDYTGSDGEYWVRLHPLCDAAGAVEGAMALAVRHREPASAPVD
jgi:PAS domain S-box-containing protein